MSEEPTLTDLLEQTLELGTPPTGEDRKMAARALRERSILRTIATVLTAFRSNEASKILSLDLAQPGAMTTAARSQGLVAGQQQFVEAIFSFLESDEEEEKEE